MTVHDPLGPVQITPRDIYDQMVAVRDQMVAVRSAVERLADRAESTSRDLTDHEQRLRLVEDVRPGPRIRDLEERMRSVEARLWPLPTVSVLLALAALALSIITRL
ncbi:hypothetical protein [Rhizomonospora bruguierae]|uniref:hypothetical protein n=1 Tax=Rhizomonospora bruguierae TaxID=1581705 RepID=UPI001BD0E745|nr:hypothetical protein [Micromonospora sp. NBRC 107566]